MVKIADTKACKEQEALDGFFKMLSSDPDSVCYGWDHVKLALERQAIKTLLISDALFRYFLTLPAWIIGEGIDRLI